MQSLHYTPIADELSLIWLFRLRAIRASAALCESQLSSFSRANWLLTFSAISRYPFASHMATAIHLIDTHCGDSRGACLARRSEVLQGRTILVTYAKSAAGHHLANVCVSRSAAGPFVHFAIPLLLLRLPTEPSQALNLWHIPIIEFEIQSDYNNSQLVLHDINGKLIRSIDLEGHLNQVVIPSGNLNNGIYFVSN